MSKLEEEEETGTMEERTFKVKLFYSLSVTMRKRHVGYRRLSDHTSLIYTNALLTLFRVQTPEHSQAVQGPISQSLLLLAADDVHICMRNSTRQLCPLKVLVLALAKHIQVTFLASCTSILQRTNCAIRNNRDIDALAAAEIVTFRIQVRFSISSSRSRSTKSCPA